MNTIVINLIGGAGVGKSTVAAKIFSIIKEKGVHAELILEFSKELIYEGNEQAFNDRVYMHAMQNHRMFIKLGKVNVIVVDSPLLLTKVYYDYYLRDSFSKGYSHMIDELVKETWNLYNNRTYYLQRMVDYETSGRRESQDESKMIDILILDYMTKQGIDFKYCTLDNIVDIVLEDLKKEGILDA